MVTVSAEVEPLVCMRGPEGCAGEVTERVSAGGTCMIPECALHMREQLDWQREHRRTYPDSPIPPSWFDPTVAGETWDDGDY